MICYQCGQKLCALVECRTCNRYLCQSCNRLETHRCNKENFEQRKRIKI